MNKKPSLGRDGWLASFAIVSLTHGATFGALVSRLNLDGGNEGWLAIAILLSGSTAIVLLANNFELLLRLADKVNPGIQVSILSVLSWLVVWTSLKILRLDQDGTLAEMMVATLVSWVMWSQLLAMYSNVTELEASEKNDD